MALERMTDQEIENVLRVTSKNDLAPAARILINELYLRVRSLEVEVNRLNDARRVTDKDKLTEMVDDFQESVGGRKNGEGRIPRTVDRRLIELLRQIVNEISD